MKKVYSRALRLRSPLHINAGTSGDGREMFVTNGQEPYIPATLFKGMLRNNMEILIRAINEGYSCKGKENSESDCGCVMCTLFGKAGYKPSRVVIDNLYCDGENIKSEFRTNNGISRYTRRVQNNALVSKTVVSSAEETVFVGNMTVYYTEKTKKYEKLLMKSVKMINSIGSSKSRGLGRVETEVTEKCLKK